MAFDSRAVYDKNQFFWEVLTKLDGLNFAAGGALSLGVFQATAAGTGYAVGALIGLIQEPPAAPRYVNIGSNAVITPDPTHLGPVGGGATVTVNGVNAAIHLLPALYDAGAVTNAQGFAWFRWSGSAHTVLGVINANGAAISGPTNVRPLVGGTAGAAAIPATLEQGANLAAIDTDAEALAADATANTAGVPTTAFTLPELSRWTIRLYQMMLARVGATGDTADVSGSLFARLLEILNRVGAAPTAGNASGTIREQLRSIADSLSAGSTGLSPVIYRLNDDTLRSGYLRLTPAPALFSNVIGTAAVTIGTAPTEANVTTIAAARSVLLSSSSFPIAHAAATVAAFTQPTEGATVTVNAALTSMAGGEAQFGVGSSVFLADNDGFQVGGHYIVRGGTLSALSLEFQNPANNDLAIGQTAILSGATVPAMRMIAMSKLMPPPGATHAIVSVTRPARAKAARFLALTQPFRQPGNRRKRIRFKSIIHQWQLTLTRPLWGGISAQKNGCSIG